MTEERVRELVRRAMPSVERSELRRDLWAEMLPRMAPRRPSAGWLDWAVVGIAAAWLLAFPEAIGGLLYHL